MENNTTFSNKESLNTRLASLPVNDTFSNQVTLQTILVGSTMSGTIALGQNDTFSNDGAMEASI
jgi:hypothetical protein